METLGGSLTLSAVSSLVDLNGNDRHETKFRADGVENVKALAPNLGKSEGERPDDVERVGEREENWTAVRGRLPGSDPNHLHTQNGEPIPLFCPQSPGAC